MVLEHRTRLLLSFTFLLLYMTNPCILHTPAFIYIYDSMIEIWGLGCEPVIKDIFF